MTITELIAKLETIREEHGDLNVVSTTADYYGQVDDFDTVDFVTPFADNVYIGCFNPEDLF